MQRITNQTTVHSRKVKNKYKLPMKTRSQFNWRNRLIYEMNQTSKRWIGQDC
jgi:hypothetical protein